MQQSETLGRWLAGLPDGTVQQHFVSVADFTEQVEIHVRNLPNNKNHSLFVIFFDIPEDAFKEITSSEIPVMRQCRFAYSHGVNCLLIEAITEIHEFAKDQFIRLFDGKISDMGLYDELRQDGD